MTASTRAVSLTEPAVVDEITIDESGTLRLPPELLALLRPDGERLTLVDVQVTDGALVLRRSSIPEEDWWAYTPEMVERINRARNSPRESDVQLSRKDLERLAGLDRE